MPEEGEAISGVTGKMSLEQASGSDLRSSALLASRSVDGGVDTPAVERGAKTKRLRGMTTDGPLFREMVRQRQRADSQQVLARVNVSKSRKG